MTDSLYAWAQEPPPTPIDKITVGAAVAYTDHHGTRFILLPKRSAQEAYYPNAFEIPGGKVDDTDPSIRDALAREVAEEAYLTITSIITSLAPFTYITEKTIREGPLVHTERKTALQLSYLVQVQEAGHDFVVNPDEHSEGLWVTADKLPTVKMTDERRKTVSKVFEAPQ
ncbi:hypothetical protein Focb16_v011621 [Fusarium oxysporum f. sp. cubense]|uniref:Nudix hydrolase domain-containing protein n=1 Tax=Fusarium oxysporum f. sp. cubense TaxID=61366 RepID=A0A559LD91_FUSOC|nr:hypothetical protein Focb16_v011621 [Fusarium oxysporum f. sp. cubense]